MSRGTLIAEGFGAGFGFGSGFGLVNFGRLSEKPWDPNFGRCIPCFCSHRFNASRIIPIPRVLMPAHAESIGAHPWRCRLREMSRLI